MRKFKKMKPSMGSGSLARFSKVAKLSTLQSLLKPENPMKIDLILEVLFDLCPASTLKNCRLVCKQWRDVSLKAWRRKATLCLNKELEKGPLTIRDCLLMRTEAKSKPIPKWLRTFHDKYKPLHFQLLMNPFRNFRIDTSTEEYLKIEAKPITDNARHLILQKIKRGYRSFGEFLSRFQSLESLELRSCDWRWKTVPGPVSVTSRNLKRLKISQYESQTPGIHHPKKCFFQQFPNIEALCVDYRTMDSYLFDIEKILKIVNSIRHTTGTGPTILMNLKELEIISISPIPSNPFWKERFEESFIDTIVECDFPLERLALDLEYSGKMKNKSAVRSMGRLLHSSRDSLQYLRTCFYFDMDVFISRVIGEMKWWKLKRALKPISRVNLTMDVLKELKLANGLCGFYLLAHLKLPNLEKLTVECGKCERKLNIQEYQVRLLKDKTFPRLRTFELLDNHEIPAFATIARFETMMPNLSALSCPLDKTAFQIVCERFKGLKTLNIVRAQCLYSELDDESLTGVDVSKKGNGEEPKLRGPNLTDLTSLTELSISSGLPAFTDHSAIHGFLQLPKLHFLSVAFKTISYEIERKLKSHVTDTVLIQKEELVDLNWIDSESDSDTIISEESFSSEDSSASEKYEMSEEYSMSEESGDEH